MAVIVPIAYCSLRKAIATRFAQSSFAKSSFVKNILFEFCVLSFEFWGGDRPLYGMILKINRRPRQVIMVRLYFFVPFSPLIYFWL
ncbi:MAG: hypothetical protein AB4372_00810, partial [Xenococcus sp. (in: cyanobacteria)]